MADLLTAGSWKQPELEEKGASKMISFLRRAFYFDNWPMVLFQRAFCRRARLLAFRRGRMEFVVDYSGGDQCGILPCLTSNMYSRYFGFFENAGR